MDALLSYRGREITTQHVDSIRALITSHPQASRRTLSLELCARWQWVQANGTPCDAVCRGLLLALHRAGHIELPAPRWTTTRVAVRHGKPPRVEVDTAPLSVRLRELGELRFTQVRRAAEEPLVDSLLDAHHYLGFTRPVGEHLKLLVRAGERPIACFVWSSAPRHIGPRDRYLGWSPATRRANVHLVAYNSRFLIMPWVKVPHLASHLLGRMTRTLPGLWQTFYGHPVWFAETFVDPTRFRGTCYRAANWTLMGRTTGRGNNDQTNRPNRAIKDMWGLGLHRHFRERLLSRER